MAGRVLLANEAGSGRGHLTTLKVFAQALGPGCIYDAALCRLDHAADLSGLCDEVFQAASLFYQPEIMAARAGRPIGNWAEFLAALGFASEAFLTRQIDWWMRTIQARCSGMVVAEFAPCAMLAARALGVPVISIGQGHSTPPAGMPQFPPSPSGLAHDEADLVAIVNRAGARFGVPPLSCFSDVYRCDAQLLRTIPALDPYASRRMDPRYLPPLGLDCPPVGQGDGTEIFVYFSSTEGDDPAIVAALAAVELPMRLVMPRIHPDLAARLQARGVAVERQPLSHAAIAARSRMIVHAGQHGTTCLALALGLPQLALPCQSEQSANAACIQAMGVLANFDLPRGDPQAIAAAITRIYVDTAMAERARALAHQLRPALIGDTAAQVRATVEEVLGGAIAA